jgi:hypothetical protein
MKSNKKSQFVLILVMLIIILICYNGSLRNFLSINVNYESIEENNFNLESSNQKVFSIIADPPESENWIAIKNEEFPIIPDNSR